MPADFTMKRNDRLPSIVATLRDGTGAIVDLTGATVVFHMATTPGAAPKVNAICTVSAPTTGVAQYDWLAADTDTAGDYVAEFQVTFASGKPATFPNGGNISITIVPDVT